MHRHFRLTPGSAHRVEHQFESGTVDHRVALLWSLEPLHLLEHWLRGQHCSSLCVASMPAESFKFLNPT